MNAQEDCLFELGCEELPPKSLATLAQALASGMESGFKSADLAFDSVHWFASPRRLAVIVMGLQTAQEAKQEQRKGPSVKGAYDKDGKPTKAAEGFAGSCGTTVDKLETIQTDKGEWLAYTVDKPGQATSALLADIIHQALKSLPIAKRMRWGSSDIEFVRPVHWCVLMLGQETISADILGVSSGNQSYGHRFHAPQALTIQHPTQYVKQLRDEGKVMVDYQERRNVIEQAARHMAKPLQANVMSNNALLDEITAINEWPVAVMGEFDPSYLELPKEVLVASMQDHQKYFPLSDQQGRLLAKFITFANIESHDPQAIQTGNERVLSPRLNDAKFFFQQDIKQPLSEYQSRLDDVLYQQKLGSLGEKSQRVKALALDIAELLEADADLVGRAAELAKCDLVTDMVNEFPELQGKIGYYYAINSGEKTEVAKAIDEHYLPRFSGDKLPQTTTGQILALADKLESIVGIFSIGQIPTGDKDPFALKRAALGALRILVECELALNLKPLLNLAATNLKHEFKASECVDQVMDFMMERLRGYYLEQEIDTLSFDAVLAREITTPSDFDQRLKAVVAFQALPQAEDLAAANKRINNILKKSEQAPNQVIDKDLLQDTAEKNLAAELETISTAVKPLFEQHQYSEALAKLAGLRDPIDAFFDQVMVMAEDENLRQNRLSLLNGVSQLFLETADISRLQASS